MAIFSSLRLRLAVLVGVAGVVVAATAFLGLVTVIDAQLDAGVDAGLRARSADVAAAVLAGDSEVPSDDPFAQVIGADGRIETTSVRRGRAAVLTRDQVRRARQGPITVETDVTALRGPARLRAVPAGQRVVVVGSGLADFNRARDRLLDVLVLVLTVLVVVLTGGAWVLVGAALRPVTRMSTAAETMSGADPHLRLPEPRGHDEIALLARTLNRLLERVEAFFTRERAFLDDASHELRTPLTVLRGELELAVDEADPDRVKEGVRVALSEAERLTALAEDLLVLARERGDDLALQSRPVDLTAWAGSVLGPLREAVPSDLRLQGTEGLVATVDVDRLERVLINLVTNAVAAGARAVRVAVSAEPSGGSGTPGAPGAPGTVLEVSDDGPGFDPELLPRAFDRFARTERARGRTDRGTGLGLAIVAALVRAHGGTVTADNDSELGGARVRVHLPSAVRETVSRQGR